MVNRSLKPFFAVFPVLLPSGVLVLARLFGGHHDLGGDTKAGNNLRVVHVKARVWQAVA